MVAMTKVEEREMLQERVDQKLKALVFRCEEYAGLEGVGRSELIRRLKEDHEWSYDTADTLYSLARDYGSFILVSALALAIVRGTEDGELGL